MNKKLVQIYIIVIIVATYISCSTYSPDGSHGYEGVQTFIPNESDFSNYNGTQTYSDYSTSPRNEHKYSPNYTNPVEQRNEFENKRNSPGHYRNGIVKTANMYIGTPYRYGGADPSGFDCSGFVMYVYGKNGFQIPRSASQQYKYGKKISYSGARPGDLVFFNTSGRGLSHVGIYLGNAKFIHSPRTGKSVEITGLNNSYYRKRIVGFRSYIN